MKSILTTAVAAMGALGMLTSSSEAGDRKFTYTYEATTSPKGAWEYEQWVTWKAYRSGGNSNTFDFRHELEVGLTDRLQLGLYLSDWRLNYEKGTGKADWRSAGAELIWNLSNPTTDFLGSALYGEVKVGDEIFVLEGKLILQKNFGPWVVAYNAIVEAEWEGRGYDEEIGVLEQTLGVSYQVSPNFSVGFEALHEVEFEDWEHASENILYVGPNFSVKSGKWFATGTVLFEALGVEGEADVQTRLIFGVNF